MRKLRRGLVGLAIVLAALVAMPGTALAVQWRVRSIDGDQSGKCLDLQGGGTYIQMWPCNGGINQIFDFVGTGTYSEFRIIVNGKCVDGWRNHANQIVALGCDGTLEQKWIVRPRGSGLDLFENSRYRGQCFDIRDFGRTNIVQLWDCNTSAPHQIWQPF
jgi:hypothetical protein